MSSADEREIQESKLVESLKDALGKLSASDTSGYYDYLKGSDAILKETITYFETGTRPPVLLTTTGSVEFGIVPYWVANPTDIPGYGDLPSWVSWSLGELECLNLVPSPTVTKSDYQSLLDAINAGTAIAFDGTFFGEGPYQQLNYNWLQALANDILTKVFGLADFGDSFPTPITLECPGSGSITIAILGDWGTGETDAQDVMKAAMALDPAPDYLIHLGDVYYTGSPDLWPIYDGMGNEMAKLVEMWPSAQKAGTSFTLNSNHEMYCGAHGYFGDALGSTSFEHQDSKSYFLLQNDDWQIFGLDSAYSTTATLYMEGALDSQQTEFIQNSYDASKQVILLTHHNAYDVTGTTVVPTGSGSLWNDAVTALDGTSPDYWYWGHIHAGVVYTTSNVTTKMRCLGHAATPYGAPWGLTNPGSEPPFGPSDYNSSVEFSAGTPVNSRVPGGQVKNGFAVITLTGKILTEAMYDSDGTKTWSTPPA